MKRSFIREILEHTTDETISFAGGLPDVALFPLHNLQSASQKALATPQALQYATSTGYSPLKKHIAQWYCHEGFKTSEEEILITSGSQQALDIITRYHRNKSMMIESPSYLGALNLFHLNAMQIEKIALYHDGIDIETFSKKCSSNSLLYLIPDFQNPTGYCTSQDKRKLIAAHCKSENVLLIEDAPYSRLFFEKPLKSISSLIPSHSYHLGSFSKILSPALRIGWIRADKSLLSPLIAYKEAMDLHTNSISQRIVYHYLQDNIGFERHLTQLRKHYKQKMEHFSNLLENYLPNFKFIRPKGGMFIYGRFEGVETTKLVYRCLQEGVVFVPGSEFGAASDTVRFNFTNSSLEQMEFGIKKIAKLLHET